MQKTVFSLAMLADSWAVADYRLGYNPRISLSGACAVAFKIWAPSCDEVSGGLMMALYCCIKTPA